MIDDIRSDNEHVNPLIEEHAKHSLAHYYEFPKYLWGKPTEAPTKNELNALAKKYRLLDDAIKDGADLTGVKYIVIPDVGATDDAITSRTDELDALFKANPHLTLVVAFTDDVMGLLVMIIVIVLAYIKAHYLDMLKSYPLQVKI